MIAKSINKINIKKIVEREGTPLYVYDYQGIKERIIKIKELLGNASLIYAVKANPNLQILKKIRPFIDGLDISSGGELKQALLAGYDPAVVSFAGPAKSEEEIKFAINNNCGSLSIESNDDLLRIIRLAKELGKKANVSLRINPAELIPKFAIKMGGMATQFGVDEEAIYDVLNKILQDQNCLNFVGFHIYAGTQCLDAESLGLNFKNIFSLIKKIITKLNLSGLKINVGGGFGIPYFDGQEHLDLEQTILFLKKEVLAQGLENFPIVIELGRYIVGEFGFYVTRVLAVKESRGKRYLIVDGGMHQNLSASGNLGQVIKKSYQVENITSESTEKIKYDVAGSLCTPLDMLGWGIEFPKTEVGDLLVIKNSGAYGYTASPLLFLGHETPKEILAINSSEYEVIRPSFDITSFN